jgi:hypothetical protein
LPSVKSPSGIRRPIPIAALSLYFLAAGCIGSGAPNPTITDVTPAFAVIGTTFGLGISGNFDAFAGATVHVSVARTNDLFGNVLAEPRQEIASGQLGSGPIRNLYLEMATSAAAPVGLYSLHIAGSGKDVSMRDAFALLPVPALDHSAHCLAGGASPLRILGSAIPIIGGSLPVVRIATAPYAFPSYQTTPEVTAASCHSVVHSRVRIDLCDELHLQVPADALAGDLTVTAEFAGLGTPALTLSAPLLIDRPVDFALRGPYATADSEANIVWHGNFHRGGASPSSAAVDGAPVTPVFDDCTRSSVPGESWCGTLTIPLPQGTPAGIRSYTFTSMSGCTSAGSAQVLDPPQVASMEPGVICAAGSDFPLIHGSGFYETRVFVGDLETLPSGGCPPGPTLPASTCGTIAIWPRPRCVLGICPLYQPGQYMLSVENGTTPPIRRALATPITVEPGPPLVSGPSPMNIYNGVDRPVFVGIGNQTGNVVSAEFKPWGGVGTPVPAKAVTPAPGGALITAPAGLAAQWWQIVVHDESANCPGIVPYPVIPQTSFVTYGNDFEGSQAPLYVYFDTVVPRNATADLAPGNGGGNAAHFAGSAGDPDWYFTLPLGAENDFATARFDLRRIGTGNATARADVSIFGQFFELNADLSPPPQDAWTHYDVALADPAAWTYRGQDGSTRPATAADLRTVIDENAPLRIRGSAYDGQTDASIDNVSVELAH